MSETKIKSIVPTSNLSQFDETVAKYSKELNGFATQTSFAVDSQGTKWYWAVIFYRV